MKTLYFNKPLLYLLLSTSFLLGAQTVERSIRKDFPLSAKGKLVIDNSYGTVKLNSWDKEKVSIEVIIKVNTENQEQAREALENIEVDFEHSVNLVQAITIFPENNRSWWKNWSFFGTKKLDYSINYLIQMPASAELAIDNEYGNIFIDQTDGLAALSCAYGTLEAGQLNHPKNRIKLDYSPNSEIEFVNGASIEADYSVLSIIKANKIDYIADYTKSTFGQMGTVNFSADYGSLSLKEVNRLIGKADYLSIKIGSLNTALDLGMDYGSLKVAQIESSTKEVFINADYTGIRLGIDPDWDFAFSVTTEYAGFKYDFPLNMKKKIIETTDHFYQGQYRSGKNQLKINANYGGIKLSQN